MDSTLKVCSYFGLTDSGSVHLRDYAEYLWYLEGMCEIGNSGTHAMC